MDEHIDKANDEQTEAGSGADRQLSRRDFLKIAGVAGATVGLGAGLGGLVAACGGTTTTTTTASTAGTTTTAAASTTTTTAAGSTTTVSTAAQTGRPIIIGAVSPLTGSLAAFGGPDKWITSYVLAATKAGVVCGDGKNHPITINQQDSQSSASRVAQVTGDLIFNAKADIIVASSSPDTVNPAADQCEANGVPFLANFVPWQPFFFGRKATPATPFKWTWMFHFGLEDAAAVRIGAWNQIQTNKSVNLLFPNDADGVAWADAKTGLGVALTKGGYKIASQPPLFQSPADDFTAQISQFKKDGAEIVSGIAVPPDYVNFYNQAMQQGLRPKVFSIAKASLFHESIEAIGDNAVFTSDHNVWHPTYPYKSALTGQTCQEYADQYTSETGKQWTQPLGQLGKYEWAIDVLKRMPSVDDKSTFPDIVAKTNFANINGPIDFTQPVATGTTHPVLNVFKIKIAYGQWIKLPAGSKYKYDQVLVFAQDPAMPVKNTLQPMKYV